VVDSGKLKRNISQIKSRALLDFVEVTLTKSKASTSTLSREEELHRRTLAKTIQLLPIPR